MSENGVEWERYEGGMGMVLILSQVIGVIAVGLYLLSFQLKKRVQIAWVTCLSYVFYVAQYLMLGAFSGAAMDVLSAALSFIAANKTTPRFKGAAKPLMVLFCGLIVASGVVIAILRQSWLELLPIAGALLQAGGLWFTNEQTIRKCGLAGAPFWLVYNFMSQAYGAALGAALTVVSTVVAMIRYQKKKTEL